MYQIILVGKKNLVNNLSVGKKNLVNNLIPIIIASTLHFNLGIGVESDCNY